jgi:hypothetical protein
MGSSTNDLLYLAKQARESARLAAVKKRKDEAEFYWNLERHYYAQAGLPDEATHKLKPEPQVERPPYVEGRKSIDGGYGHHRKSAGPVKK